MFVGELSCYEITDFNPNLSILLQYVVAKRRDFAENKSPYFVFVDLGEGGVVFWRRLCQFGPRSLVLAMKLQGTSFFDADKFLTQVMNIPFSGFTFERPVSIT